MKPVIIDHTTQRPIDAPPAPEPLILYRLHRPPVLHYEETRARFPDAVGFGTGEDLGLVVCERNEVKRARERKLAEIKRWNRGG